MLILFRLLQSRYVSLSVRRFMMTNHLCRRFCGVFYRNARCDIGRNATDKHLHTLHVALRFIQSCVSLTAARVEFTDHFIVAGQAHRCSPAGCHFTVTYSLQTIAPWWLSVALTQLSLLFVMFSVSNLLNMASTITTAMATTLPRRETYFT